MNLTTEQKQFWDENGYILLKSYISTKRIDQINALVQRLCNDRKKLDASYVIDIFVETDKEAQVYFSDAPIAARDKPYKLNDLFLSQTAIRNLVARSELSPILGQLLEGKPMVCNSLNFEFGSQQDYHFEPFYMPSPTPNKMVASWITLEDATEKNGPLSYYPGSHKVPPFYFSNDTTVIMQDEMEAFNDYVLGEIEKRDLQAETLLANKGDVLIWHSQLFHGGSPIVDKSKSRKSLVTHYFTQQDFPAQKQPEIAENSCYMARAAQPVRYPFASENWLQQTFA